MISFTVLRSRHTLYHLLFRRDIGPQQRMGTSEVYLEEITKSSGSIGEKHMKPLLFPHESQKVKNHEHFSRSILFFRTFSQFAACSNAHRIASSYSHDNNFAPYCLVYSLRVRDSMSPIFTQYRIFLLMALPCQPTCYVYVCLCGGFNSQNIAARVISLPINIWNIC